MGTIILRTLEDYARWGCNVRITCRQCGRSMVYSAFRLSDYYRKRRWTTDLDLAHVRFKCDGCGARDADVSPEAKSSHHGLQDPYPKPFSKGSQPCPTGIDPVAWGKATDSERTRLLRRARG